MTLPLALNVIQLAERLSLRESSRPGAGERAEIPLSAGYAATSPKGRLNRMTLPLALPSKSFKKDLYNPENRGIMKHHPHKRRPP